MSEQPKPRKRKVYEIPQGTPERKCRSCHATVFWINPRAGVRLPVNPDGVSHFETCPQASDWSHGKKGPNQASAMVPIDVVKCARCGGDHGKLAFYKLTRAAKDFQWWSLCPNTGEPILMRVVEKGAE